MVTAWRIVRPAYAATALSGEGARLYGGRWNRVGTPVVYLSEHRSLAVLEVLTQALDTADQEGLLVVSATFDDADVVDIALADLPPNWQALPAPEATAALGTAWAERRDALVLRVPGAILPAEANYVLNPLHPRMGTVEIGPAVPGSLDPRLARAQAEP